MARDYLVYLAGPMTGLTVQDAMKWRNYVRKHLPPHIKTRSPVLTEFDPAQKGTIEPERPQMPMGTGKEFTRKDFNDVRRSDLIFVHLLGADEKSVGTISEIAWAYALRIPIVAVMEPNGNVHEHPFIREQSTKIVPNLDEGVEITKMLLLDDDTLLREGVER